MGTRWVNRQASKILASWRRSRADTIEVTLSLPVPVARALFDTLGTALTIADASEPPTFEEEPDG